VAIAVVVLLVAAACGGKSDAATGASPTSAPAGKAGEVANSDRAAAVQTAAAVIDQAEMNFVPAKVTVKVGETVLVKNSEAVIHTANINNKNISGNMKKGDAVPWIARSPGEYKVTCDYHPLMKATIVVTS